MSVEIEITAKKDLDVTRRANELFSQCIQKLYERTDGLFACLMVVQWIAGIAAAFWISPHTWAGTYHETHAHVWAAIVLGGLISLFPVALVALRPGTMLTRHVVAISQMLTSALLIHLCGGRIETHFHIFGSLAFLACYRDWRVLATATLVVAVDHIARGLFVPQSVFGVVTTNLWRVFEHMSWILFENLFLIIAINQSLREMKKVARQRAALESNHATVEREVKWRTQQLDATNRSLQEAKLAAEAANQSKSEFLANMSHEIRTPMTAILGFTDMLYDSVTEPECKEAARTVKENGAHLIHLINDILDLSKIEVGKLETEQIPCSPHAIISDVTSLMRVRASAKGLPLSMRYDGPIPETICSDPTRLRQILVNIIGNAIKFTETGSVTLATRLVTGSDESPALRFDVIDTGIGIPPDKIDRLFQPFTQADTSTTREFGGTGLGLTICRRLAQLLGGKIVVESQPDKGSTFSVVVKTGSLDGVKMIDDSSESVLVQPARKNTNDGPIVLQGCRVLLAEDGPDNQRLISFILKKAGAEVVVAENGKIAVEQVQAASMGRRFDVVLMDIQMPVMDGHAATRILRQDGYSGAIIALTAHAMVTDRQKCLDAGCDEFASKPIDRAKLVEIVHRYANCRQETV